MGNLYYLLHPNQLRSILQWKFLREPVHKRDESDACESLKTCFYYLAQTSRSFVVVIKELHPELLLPVTLFYLALRGLDTVEDDPTLPVAVKEPMLRDFQHVLDRDGWTFDGSGPNERDRALLVHFDSAIAELKKIPRPYFNIIRDITGMMGNGMADFVVDSDRSPDCVQTVADYETYCHYVAGLVGEGLTRLFIEAKLAHPRLLEQPHLAESMGQLLQKTNIIRDVKEDWDDERRWWPRDVWSKYVDEWDHMFDPAHRELAMQCAAEMVLNALSNVEHNLFYMAALREQSVFNFCAIPQAMAIATLELVFRNPAMFDRNVKISKGDACSLMLQSTQSHRVLCEVFRHYARRIHQKNDPRDRNYLAISVQCAKIEQCIEKMYPSQAPVTTSLISNVNITLVLGAVFIAVFMYFVLGTTFGGMSVDDTNAWASQGTIDARMSTSFARAPEGHPEL